jgi:predicted enzyme related to lactoylglutathione lyase
MPIPRLYRVILPVFDIERAANFYAAVFGVPGSRVSPGRHYFDCGGTLLACYDPIADGDGAQGSWQFHPSQYLYFADADLEAVRARVTAAGGTITEDIRSMPWGERMFSRKIPLEVSSASSMNTPSSRVENGLVTRYQRELERARRRFRNFRVVQRP